MSSELDIAPPLLIAAEAQPLPVATDPHLAGNEAAVVPQRRRRGRPSAGLLVRLTFLAAFILVAYGGVFYETAVSIAGGSRTAYLAVLPVLIATIAFGCSAPPRGVSDSEADWILASVVGGLGLILHFLMRSRLPNLAALWHQQLVGAIIWTGFAATILFGLRRVSNMWPMWLFALICATPLPYLLTVSWLGGSTFAASAVAAAIGAAAVFLAGRHSPVHWRLLAAVSCAVVGIGAAGALAARPLLLSVVVSAGVTPVVAFAVLDGLASRWPTLAPPMPRRSPFSMGLLALVAITIMSLNMPIVSAQPIPRAEANWQESLGFARAEQFEFIHRYLGGDATFARYDVPSDEGYPTAAVDVIATDNLEALRDLHDVIWYPVSTMPNYVPFDVGTSAITGARAAASDSANTLEANEPNWYAVTWTWRAGNTYQQVLVVVNQSWPSAGTAPPKPQLLSAHDTVAAPALWMTRQQANPAPELDPIVTERMREIINEVVRAGAPQAAT